MQKKSVLIRIVNKTETFFGDFNSALLFNGKNDDEQDFYGINETDGGDFWLGLGFDDAGNAPVIFETEGLLTEENGSVVLSYINSLDDIIDAEVRYCFDKHNRNVLTVVRDALYSEVYFFEVKYKRQIVTYESENSRIELSLYTRSLKNNITYENGGYIEIEYFAEVKAGVVEHCREYLIVEPI